MELSSKKAVRDLVEICAQKGIKHVVISPGSRNAPLTISFNRHPGFKCHTVVDERSAAFYAMGIAQQLKEPVAICCTSGSAALNYPPAIVEAFYQKIPLLVLTADRPPEWIDQMDGQTIRQDNIFNNYIKGSFSFPVDGTTDSDRWFAQRLANEAIDLTQYPEAGPVHINLPFREPLYDVLDYSNEEQPKVFGTTKTLLELPEAEIALLKEEWKSYDKVLIITGLLHPNEELNDALNEVAEQENVAILTETTSNVFGEKFNRSIDRLITGIAGEENNFKPDLLVTLGGPVVSKKVKAFLRQYQPAAHWHINASNDAVDTYQALTKIIPLSPERILNHLKAEKKSDYRDSWLRLDERLQVAYNEFVNDLEFSDLKAFEIVFNHIPKESYLQLANSTAVRYSNLFDQPSQNRLKCFSNRGVSGIDGTLSTSVGAAVATKKQNTVITGDLSFFYDSNSLWIKPFPANLNIILINNQGGSIFRIIDGPSQIKELEQFFEVKHDLTAEHIAKTFGINYCSCDSSEGLAENLKEIYNTDQPFILEVHTNNELNPDVLSRYFKHLKGA